MCNCTKSFSFDEFLVSQFETDNPACCKKTPRVDMLAEARSLHRQQSRLGVHQELQKTRRSCYEGQT